MPLPMNITAKRLGKGPAAPAVSAAAPQTGIDSSHGRAMVTPAPRRKILRDGCDFGISISSCCCGYFGPAPGGELRAGDDALDQCVEPVAVGGELCPHVFECRLVGQHQASSERVGQHL